MTPTLPQFNLSIRDLLDFIQDTMLDGPTPQEGSIAFDRLLDEEWLFEEVGVRRIPWDDKLDWPDIYTQMPCFFCAHSKTFYIKTRRIWKCAKCQKQFGVRIGTFMEDSPLPLNKWLRALWWWQYSEGFVNTYQLAKELGVRQATAWQMKYKIKKAIEEEKCPKP